MTQLSYLWYNYLNSVYFSVANNGGNHLLRDARWFIGRFYEFRAKGRGFESHSSLFYLCSSAGKLINKTVWNVLRLETCPNLFQSLHQEQNAPVVGLYPQLLTRC